MPSYPRNTPFFLPEKMIAFDAFTPLAFSWVTTSSAVASPPDAPEISSAVGSGVPPQMPARYVKNRARPIPNARAITTATMRPMSLPLDLGFGVFPGTAGVAADGWVAGAAGVETPAPDGWANCWACGHAGWATGCCG